MVCILAFSIAVVVVLVVVVVVVVGTERIGVESTDCGNFNGVVPIPNTGAAVDAVSVRVKLLKSKLPSSRTPYSAIEEDSSA